MRRDVNAYDKSFYLIIIVIVITKQIDTMETVTDSGASNMRVNVSTTLDFISHNTTRDTTQVYAVNQLDRILEFQTRGAVFFTVTYCLCVWMFRWQV